MNYKEFFKEEMIVGRRGKKFKGKDVDPKQLKMGIKVEMEHTKDKKISERIALDHLAEDPLYYTKLKKAGLADELDENNLFGLSSPLAIFPDKQNSQGIQEPDAGKVDKQTEPGTVFPKVADDPSKGPDMQGSIGSTNFGGGGVQIKTNVEAPPKDPQPTKHVTGGMEGADSNPNILPKNGTCGGGAMMMGMPAEPQDISIDIKEGKKLLKKMLKESTIPSQHYEALQDHLGDWKVYEPSQHGTYRPVTGVLPKDAAIQKADEMNRGTTVKGPGRAFGPKEGFVPAAGDPSKDPHYVKGKRWTVDYGVKTPTMKEMDTALGDHNSEVARQAVRTVVSQSNYNEEEDMGSILAYLQDQGINVSEDEVERMYRQEMDRRMSGAARRPVVGNNSM